MQKIVNKKIISIVCSLLILMLIGYLAFNHVVTPAKAETTSEEKIAYYTEQKYSFTNNDVVNGININTYASNNLGNNVSNLTLTNNVVMDVAGNDDIVKVLPESLFKTPGKTFHIGREWGFFVDCFKPYDDIDILISTVILFDLDTNGGNVADTQYKSHLRFAFKRTLQADFAYVPSSEETMFSMQRKVDDNIYSDGYHYDVILHYTDNASYHIIPVPIHYSSDTTGSARIRIEQHDKYYFTEMVSALSLHNVNAKNYGDNGYDINDDYGAFISQVDYEYDGLFIKPGNASISAAVKGLAGRILVSKIKSYASKIPYVNKVMKVVDAYQEIERTVEDFNENAKSKAIEDENKLTYNAFHNSYDAQRSDYGYLVRNALLTISNKMHKKVRC